jgi:hypothetical protein
VKNIIEIIRQFIRENATTSLEELEKYHTSKVE